MLKRPIFLFASVLLLGVVPGLFAADDCAGDRCAEFGTNGALRRAVGDRPQLPPQESSALAPSVLAPASSTLDATQIAAWKLEPGNLKAQLQGWAESAGWQLVWNSSTDYRVDAAISLHGTVLEAIDAVITSYHENGASLRAQIFNGNKVILIKEG